MADVAPRRHNCFVTSAELAPVAALGATLLMGTASLGVVWWQHYLQGKDADCDALIGAVSSPAATTSAAGESEDAFEAASWRPKTPMRTTEKVLIRSLALMCAPIVIARIAAGVAGEHEWLHFRVWRSSSAPRSTMSAKSPFVDQRDDRPRMWLPRPGRVLPQTAADISRL